MPYTLPTVDQFKEAYPEFADVDDEKITAAINRAARQVDETWLEEDYQPAIMALAAHYGVVTASGAESFGQDNIKSLTIGPLSLTYGDKLSATDFNSTTYGQTFTSLRKLNIPAIAVI